MEVISLCCAIHSIDVALYHHILYFTLLWVHLFTIFVCQDFSFNKIILYMIYVLNTCNLPTFKQTIHWIVLILWKILLEMKGMSCWHTNMKQFFLLLRTLNANGDWMLSLLVQKAGCFGTLLIVVKCYAIVAPVPDPHPVHIEPPAMGVVLVYFRAAHFQLQPWGQDTVHSLLQCVIAPMS